MTPGQQPPETLSDRHDRARRILDDAEHGETRCEVEQAEPEREVPFFLDQQRDQAEDAGEQGPRDETDTTDDEREHDRQTGDHLETGRAVQRLRGHREERAGKAGDAGREGEHREFRLEHVHSDGHRRGFAVAQGDQPPAEGAAPERDDTYPAQPEHDRDQDDERLRRGEVDAEQVHARHRPLPGPDREGLRIEHLLDHGRERECRQREIQTMEPHRREREEGADRHRHECGEEDRPDAAVCPAEPRVGDGTDARVRERRK